MNWQQQAHEIFGEHWKATLAAALGCSKRAIQYWASGQRKMPDDLAEKINATYKIWRNNP